MTKRRYRHHRNTRGLKALLLTASVIATIGGARLLELQEPVEARLDSQVIAVVEPAVSSRASAIFQSGQRATIQLKPIPQVVVPQLNPVARARSSM